MKYKDFKDGAIFDLLNFIDIDIEYTEDEEIYYSVIDFQDSSAIYSLFDKNQKIGFSYKDGYADIINLDDNRLLTINFIPTVESESAFFFYFLYTSANSYTIKTKRDDIGKTTVILESNIEGRKPIIYEEVNYPNIDLPATKTPILKLIKPVSFEQMLERGKIEGKSK